MSYDYRNCQSLFGYAARVHARSGGVCQLCGCGGVETVDFDLWRQLTVEHLIGESQGGYRRQIRQAIAQRFPDISSEYRAHLLERIDEANTVTACSFCNATTSRDVHTVRMDALIETAPGTPEDVVAIILRELEAVLQRKRADVAWKLSAVRQAFDQLVVPALRGEQASQASMGEEQA